MTDLSHCAAEPLVRFIPVLLDRLLSLMVRPPVLAQQIVNLAQSSFETVGCLVGRIAVRESCWFSAVWVVLDDAILG